MADVFERFQVTTVRVDLTDMDALERVLLQHHHQGKATVVWMETPSNPLTQVLDIAAICQTVQQTSSHKNNTLVTTTVVDSTLAPPVLTQPLLHGADCVLHLATKYLGGHSDVLLGVVTCSPWMDRGQELGPRL